MDIGDVALNNISEQADAVNEEKYSHLMIEDLFAYDEVKFDKAIDEYVNSVRNGEQYDNLDSCINNSYKPEMCTIALLIRDRPRTKRQKLVNLKPIAFVRLNTRKGKPKPVTIKALLDSGAAGCLVSKKFVSKLKFTKSSQEWSTPSGELTTKGVVKAQFTLPEL